MPSLVSNWDLDEFVDEQRYYCSETPIDINNLPAPKLILAGDVRSISDSDIEEKRYYLLLSSVKNSVEKFGEQVSIWASNKDEFYQQVELLLLANATSYPSTMIVDKSKYARAVTRSGVTIVNSLATIDGGAFDFTHTSGIRYSQSSISALNTSDFTIELFVKVNSYSQYYPRIFIIGASEAIGAGHLQMQVASNGKTTIYVNGGEVGRSIEPVGTALKHHCIMRKDGVFYYYIDRVLQSTVNSFTNYSISQTNFRLGGYDRNIVGYKSSVRITRLLRYDINGFEVPTKIFPTS